ncbi:DUF2818 family protein [Methylophilaceae bacterium]|jgi:hypothetical protein|nr:DUF2818 family protein [Methylophilaceae bacterium]
MIFLIILLALLLANLPWLTNDFLFFLQKPKKNNFLIFFELIIFYFIFGAFLLFIEKQTLGNIHAQGWEFYIITFFLFLVFSFPGFIYKVVWK